MAKQNGKHGALLSMGLWQAIQVTLHEAGPGYVDSEGGEVSEAQGPEVQYCLSREAKRWLICIESDTRSLGIWSEDWPRSVRSEISSSAEMLPRSWACKGSTVKNVREGGQLQQGTWQGTCVLKPELWPQILAPTPAVTLGKFLDLSEVNFLTCMMGKVVSSFQGRKWYSGGNDIVRIEVSECSKCSLNV